MIKGFTTGGFFLLCLALCAGFARAENFNPQTFADGPIWHNLLHYNPTTFGGFTSEADEESFFFHPEGKTNPLKELKKTLEIFKKDLQKEVSAKSSFCHFPARYRALAKQIQEFPRARLKDCPKYQKFRDKMEAEALALVFSSYYLNTPASAFGHTFMRFIKHPEGKNRRKYQLLDYAANYAATVTTSNSLIYAYQGLTGGFEGEFSSLPYFYKVREYNDYESRDLWSYELNLTDDEREMVIAHLWEMRQTTFDYYYLTENCSYHMLTLLDVANPEWRLADRNPDFVVPIDTIRTIKNTEGLIGNVTFRPSKRREAIERVERLNEREEALFEKLIESPQVDVSTVAENSALPKKQKAKALDATIDYIDFQHSENVLMKEGKWKNYKNDLLLTRAKLGVSSPTLNIQKPKNERPHTGHKTKRVALAAGRGSQSEEFLRLDYRFSLHDFFDSDQGHNPNASIEMGNIELRAYPEYQNSESGRVSLEEFALVRVTSLSPYKEYFSTWSWKLDVGYKTFRTLERGFSCELCHGPYGVFGGGTSVEFGNFVTSALLVGESQVAKGLSHNGFLAGAGPEVLLLWNPLAGLKVGAEADYKKYWPSSRATEKPLLKISPKVRYGFKDSALGIEGRLSPYEDEIELVYYHYL